MFDELFPTAGSGTADSAQSMPEFCRVLIVEDDETFCALCTRYLSRASTTRYEIVPAPRVEIAMHLCKKETFDCLVVDYRLPDGTGTDFLAALTTALNGSVPPAIILTAAGGEQAAIQAIKVNATDFMTKAEVSRTSLIRAVDNAVVKYKLRQSVMERNASLESAYSELKKNNDEIKQFYQSVSHEVKTPLTSMQEFLMLLNDEVAGPVSFQQKELLGFALESCDQIAVHFEDLLDVTRLDTDKLVLRTTLQSPAKVIQRCIVGAGGEARLNNVTLITRVSEPLPDLMLDANRMSQILGNLLSNAIKFTDSGGQVVLECQTESASRLVVVTVADTGCGFDPALSERVFDRLYQIHHGVRDEAGHGGLGLGLSIARDLARLHGGNVDCISTSAQGSTFRLTLPLPMTESENG